MPKKILVIDDSALMRRVISDIINEGNEYEVAAIAKDGLEGLDLIVSHPNLYEAVILDINMPKMNGLELLERLQINKIEQTVIVVSTVAKREAKETIKALELGAFDFVTKPENYLETKSEAFKQKIHNMLDLATQNSGKSQATNADLAGRSRVRSSSRMNHVDPDKKLDTRMNDSRLKDTRINNAKNNDASTGTVRRTVDHIRRALTSEKRSQSDLSSNGQAHADGNKLIALACSTGGPKSLQQVIPYLPENLDAGMVLVQHMPKGFTASLAQRLNEISKVHVKEAEDGDVIEKGHVYIAPGGQHMKIATSGSRHVIKLSDDPAIDGLRPCANLMYESLCSSNYEKIVCVVLTGMGADGTNGIKDLALKKKNIHVIAQDEDSCVVYGMPKAITQSGLVNEVVSLHQIAETITKNVGVS